MAESDFTPSRVFIHGAGRRGTAAWPHIAPDAGEFLSFSPESTVEEQVARLAKRVVTGHTIIYAHSIGAVPAVLAAVQRKPAALVLVEPALYDIARGDAAIERHIAVVTEARAQAAAGDLRAFWAIQRPLMFGGPIDFAEWERERPVAEHWASTNVPWGHGVRRGMLRDVPTLIVTGGWNEEYETIAAALADDGAQHTVLPGAQHRPMDLAEFLPTVLAFEESIG